MFASLSPLRICQCPGFPHFIRTAIIIIIVTILPLLASAPVSAATITVNSDCSLSDAIKAANDDSNAHDTDCAAGSGDDTINLSGNVSLSADPTTITSNINLQGGGYTIDGNNSYRPLNITGGAVTINNVILYDGFAGSGNDGGILRVVGGVVTATNSAFYHGRVAGSRNGGAVYLETGTLTIGNSTIVTNISLGDGAGIYAASGNLNLTHVTMTDNVGISGSKASLRVESATAKIRNTIINPGTSLSACLANSAVSESVGNVFIGATSNCGTAASTGDPLLYDTGDGYFRPMTGSPAIGVGNNTYCDDYSSDQAGQSRTATGCDAGSVEYDANFNTPTPTLQFTYTPSHTPSNTPTPSDTPTATPTRGPTTINVDATCTLDQAIQSANDNQQPSGSQCEAGGAGRDTIVLSGNITLAASLPTLTSRLRINGGGYSIDGAGSYRAFRTSGSANVIIDNVRVTNAFDGALYVDASATALVTNSVFDNSESYAGGAAHSEGATHHRQQRDSFQHSGVWRRRICLCRDNHARACDAKRQHGGRRRRRSLYQLRRDIEPAQQRHHRQRNGQGLL